MESSRISRNYQTSAVADFTIHKLQFLNEQAEATQILPDYAQDSAHLLALYRGMVLTRTLDQKAINLQRTGKMGTFPSSLGQEAVTVGMGAALHETDVFCPYYRDQGAFLQRGISASKVFTYWGGDERGSDFNVQREDFPICIPIASQLLHAAGVAYAIKYRQQKRAVLTICGDGGTSKGDFFEALNLSGVWHLPMVVVINNNQWAISAPNCVQTNTATLAQKAIAAGIEALQVDGNDIIAVHTAVSHALEKARNGGGATLIEALTYRLCDHTTADDATRYGDKQQLEKAWEIEPIARLRTYLHNQGLWDKEKEFALQKDCATEVEAAVAEYLALPPQAPTDMLDYLYAELPDALQEQREILEKML